VTSYDPHFAVQYITFKSATKTWQLSINDEGGVSATKTWQLSINDEGGVIPTEIV